MKSGDFTGTTQRGGFSPTEWQEIDIMLTKLKAGTTWDNTNSALYSAETFYYNAESDDGDLAGRVLIETDEAWQVLMMNYAAEEQSVIFEYGAAV